MTPVQPFAFGPYVFHPESGTLLRDGLPVGLGHRALLLLEAFAKRPGEVLTKAELMDAAWQGAAVEESNLSVQVAALRKRLGNMPDGREWIATIPRVGYRFAAGSDDASPMPRRDDRQKHWGPRLAVLPFASIGSDPEQNIFAEGLVQDIISTLSNLSGLVVIARQKDSSFEAAAPDVWNIAAAFDAGYLLDGSVRKDGNRIRIGVQLIDASAGIHLWAERYDRDLGGIFAIQDEITLRIATELQVRLTEGDQARLHYTTTANVAAWTHWVRGRAATLRGPDRANRMEAQKNWERALYHDPNSAPLNAALAFAEFVNARNRWGDRAAAIGKGIAYAERALELDPLNPDAHVFRALLLLAQRRFVEAVALAKKAIGLAPGSSDVAAFASWVLASTGHPAEALAQAERAMTLSPVPISHQYGHLGNAYRLLGHTDQAIDAFRKRHAAAPGFGLVDLVITLEQAGRSKEARKEAEKLISLMPTFTVQGWLDTQFRSDTDQLEADVAALRAAGVPA